MQKIDREFLESVRSSLQEKYKMYTLGRLGSLYAIDDNIFYFNLWNLLPKNDTDVLDGHYTVVVNSTNFNYFIYQNSYYGSLTYTTEAKDKTIYFKKDLPNTSKDLIDLYTSNYILNAYFYDHNHVNQQGSNLYPTKYCITGNIEDYGTIEKGACIFGSLLDFSIYKDKIEQLNIK
jgi:hypothetical protein